MIRNTRHTGIVVTDLDRAIAFYTELGFEEINRAVETGPFIEQVTGVEGVSLEWIKLSAPDQSVLELLRYGTVDGHGYGHSNSVVNSGEEQKRSSAPVDKLGCSHIAFTVDDIEQTLAMICRLGGSQINEPALAPTGKVKVAYCHDPEGVLMEIVEEL